jgi:hypothetical protein
LAAFWSPLSRWHLGFSRWDDRVLDAWIGLGSRGSSGPGRRLELGLLKLAEPLLPLVQLGGVEGQDRFDLAAGGVSLGEEVALASWWLGAGRHGGSARPRQQRPRRPLAKAHPTDQLLHQGGWQEQRVVVRAWIVSVLLVVLALAMIKLR